MSLLLIGAVIKSATFALAPVNACTHEMEAWRFRRGIRPVIRAPIGVGCVPRSARLPMMAEWPQYPVLKGSVAAAACERRRRPRRKATSAGRPYRGRALRGRISVAAKTVPPGPPFPGVPPVIEHSRPRHAWILPASEPKQDVHGDLENSGSFCPSSPSLKLVGAGAPRCHLPASSLPLDPAAKRLDSVGQQARSRWWVNGFYLLALRWTSGVECPRCCPG